MGPGFEKSTARFFCLSPSVISSFWHMLFRNLSYLAFSVLIGFFLQQADLADLGASSHWSLWC